MSMRVLSSAALLVLGFASSAQAGPLFIDSFDDPSALGIGTTGYTEAPQGSVTTPGEYGLVSDPGAYWGNGYTHYVDHTQGDGTGGMLFFDGADSATTPIWQGGSGILVPGQTYKFSYWVSAADATSTPQTQALIDFVPRGPVFTATDGVWTQATCIFTATHAGFTYFSIVDDNTDALGNAGAIDDLALFATPVPEPATTTLLLAGLGALGLVARRRRR